MSILEFEESLCNIRSYFVNKLKSYEGSQKVMLMVLDLPTC